MGKKVQFLNHVKERQNIYYNYKHKGIFLQVFSRIINCTLKSMLGMSECFNTDILRREEQWAIMKN